MKFRWKLLILVLVISIIPIVSLRSFGIQNVRLMADALISQVKRNQIGDVRHRLQLVINEYAKVIRTSREQVEMALFYQTFEVSRILQTDLSWSPQSKPSSAPDASGTISKRIIAPRSRVSVESVKNAKNIALDESEPCVSAPPSADAAYVESLQIHLKRTAPMYQAASQYLGNLILRQYVGLENGSFSVYPCDHEIQHTVGSNNQIWYQSAFEEKATIWSRPYIDPVAGRIVMAASYPITREDESVMAVTSVLVPLSSLLEQAIQMSELPAGTRSYLCTLAFISSTGAVEAKISASSESSERLPLAQDLEQSAQWLDSSDKEQLRAMLEDIARRQFRIREMPFKGRPSFWAYGPLLHQGSAFVFIVPRDQIINLKDQAILESIQRRLKKVENYTVGFLIILILFTIVIAFIFSRTVTKPLARLAAAAQRLSSGDFEAKVLTTSKDEFGKMARIFNSVGPELKEHYRMQRSLEVAEEIQQNLLPEAPPKISGLDIYGMTLFSDRTGGDYFDYLCVDEKKRDKLCVAVGDVVGHGIPAAILMTTARGFLRLRATMSGTLGEIVSDINREFCNDVKESGQFMTMLLARVDRSKNRMDWVRAGHDPAIRYDPDTDSFSSLTDGKGMPLGVAADTVYTASSCEIKPGQIIFLGTDGIWETCNSDKELFGKKRLQQIIHANSRESARTIALSVLDAVEDFRGKGEQEDDLTLVVTKITEV